VLRGFLILVCFLTWGMSAARAQNAIGRGPVLDLYHQHCAVCHGKDFKNGLGGTLLGDWDHVNEQQTIETITRNGLLDLGMQAFGEVLSEEEIRALAILIEEKRLQARNAELKLPNEAEPFRSRHHSFTLEQVVPSENGIFWGMDFLPDGSMLITGFEGELRHWKDGILLPPVAGTPEVWRKGQGGLLDVGVHPKYSENGWVYLSFSEELGDGVGFTKVVRGRITNNTWTDEEIIFSVDPKFANGAGVHFGSRFVFQNGYVYFGVGDRGRQHDAQDLSRPNGKLFRFHDDGRLPEDNPFADKDGAYPGIYTYGNRNPQGLAIHPQTGDLWESEHGPRGGDEINHVKKGANYGWPIITHGMNYNGTPITGITAKEGMEQPATHFTPSIAICGIDFVHGNQFPKWENDLLVGGLASEEVWRLRTKGDQVVEREMIIKNRGRVRDIACAPDGTVYLILNRNKRAGPGGLFQLIPLTD